MITICCRRYYQDNKPSIIPFFAPEALLAVRAGGQEVWKYGVGFNSACEYPCAGGDMVSRIIDFRKVMDRLRSDEFADFNDGYIVEDVLIDVLNLGETVATFYVINFSPSELERMFLTGLSKLAKIRRDYPDMFEELVK